MSATPESPRVPPVKGGILPSNVDSADGDSAPAPKAGSRFPLAIVLVVLLAFVLGAAAALVWTSSRSGPQSAASGPPTTAARPTATLAPTVSTNRRGPASAVAGALPPVNGISCDALESTVFHIHVHLAVFFNGDEQLIPFGVGVGQPWQVSDSAQGPFVQDGACFYWIHTHTDDGVVHIESPVRRRFTLGDFFAIWQETLSATQVGPAQGAVIVYVNGMRSDGDPADILLTAYARIQLDVGQDVPPYAFDFPPGD
jgi:hypothetical protein